MVSCPDCQQRLTGGPARYGANWICDRCGGRTLDLAWIRDSGGQRIVDWLLAPSRQDNPPIRISCPMCGKNMKGIFLPVGEESRIIPVCSNCHLVWAKPDDLYRIGREYSEVGPIIKNLPQHPGQQVSEPDFSPETIRKLSQNQEKQKEREPSRPAVPSPPPPQPLRRRLVDSLRKPVFKSRWQVLPALLGMPIETESTRVLSRPWVTKGLAILITLVSVATFPYLEYAVYFFGWVPAAWWRYGGLTAITSFFLHGDLLHLLGNLYFLLIFGDNVEDYLGSKRYILLILFSTLAGNLLHSLSPINWFEPSIGASGGISGIVVFYGMLFPWARITVLARSLFFYPLRFQAFTAMCIWVLLQVLGAFEQIAGFSHISALAHLGGGLVGLGYGLAFRKRRRGFGV